MTNPNPPDNSNEAMTCKTYWGSQKAFRTGSSHVASKNLILRQWLEAYLSPVEDKSCLEIGCFPGRFLPLFGDLGYTLNGIDFLPQVKEVPQFLTEHNYDVGEFWEADFTDHTIQEKFDLVYSMGFIEHFTNVEDSLQRHMDLINPEGILVISTPNFIGGFQNWLHRTLNRKNFEKHYIPAMEPQRWDDYLKAQGFEIIAQGFLGPFHFWVTPDSRNLSQKITLWSLKLLRPILARVLPRNKRMYSPYSGIIAKRTRSEN